MLGHAVIEPQTGGGGRRRHGCEQSRKQRPARLPALFGEFGRERLGCCTRQRRLRRAAWTDEGHGDVQAVGVETGHPALDIAMVSNRPIRSTVVPSGSITSTVSFNSVVEADAPRFGSMKNRMSFWVPAAAGQIVPSNVSDDDRSGVARRKRDGVQRAVARRPHRGQHRGWGRDHTIGAQHSWSGALRATTDHALRFGLDHAYKALIACVDGVDESDELGALPVSMTPGFPLRRLKRSAPSGPRRFPSNRVRVRSRPVARCSRPGSAVPLRHSAGRIVRRSPPTGPSRWPCSPAPTRPPAEPSPTSDRMAARSPWSSPLTRYRTRPGRSSLRSATGDVDTVLTVV